MKTVEADALLIGVAAVAFVGLFLFLKKQGVAAVKAVANVNAGTPYAGGGAVGTLGNAANQLSGGWLASQGEQLGDWLYNTFNGDPMTTDGTTLSTRKANVVDNATIDFAPSFGADEVTRKNW